MSPPTDPATEQPFVSHLVELRDRLLRMVLAVLVLLLVLFPFGNDLFALLARPVVDALPEGGTMLATKVLSPFLTPLKLAFVAALFLGMPYLLYQMWGFVAPGLYQHEKRLALPILTSSIFLFYLGAAFAYFVVLPLLFPFLVGVVPENVAVAPDISDYLDVAIKLFFAFGLAFEVPVATVLLVATGMTSPDTLAAKRPYIIVGAFVFGMLLTPPDIISQTLLAVPMWVLFEFGVLFSRSLVRRREERAAEAEADETPAEADTAPAMTSAQSNEPPPPDQDELGEYYNTLPDDFEPLSEEEMDAELDRIEAEEAADEAGTEATDVEQTSEPEPEQEPEPEAEPEPAADEPELSPQEARHAKVDTKLEEIQRLRAAGETEAARNLLYEVLVEGDESQVKVARNVLQQLDEDY